jgi:hypothetical protein
MKRVVTWRGGLAISCVLLLIGALVWFLGGGDLERLDQIASVISMFIGLAGLIVAVISLEVARRQLRQPPVVAGATDKLQSWHERAQAAAKTKEQQDAAALLFHGALLADAIAALDREFQTMVNEIRKLDPGWTREQRDQLAGKVQALATKEELLKQLKRATGFLKDHRDGRDTELDSAVSELLAAGQQVLDMIGADQPAHTPPNIKTLEEKIRTSDDAEQVKNYAATVLDVIDHLTARNAPEDYGRLASAISRRHGLPVLEPAWLSER